LTSLRITKHPILKLNSKKQILHFTFDNQKFTGVEGDTIASALLANGILTLRRHEESGSPRGVYCNIGHCFECRVIVDGMEGVRACLTPLREGMDVQSGQKLPKPFKTGITEQEFRDYFRAGESQ